MRTIVAALIASLTLIPPALAQNPPPSDTESKARALFDRGVELSNKGQWAEACPVFAEADELHSTGGTRLRLADCYEHLGELEKARAIYSLIVRESGSEQQQERVAVARDRIRRIDEQLRKPAPAPAPEPARVTPDPEPARRVEPVVVEEDHALLSPAPGVVLLGVGGAGLVVGAVLGGLALAQEADVRDACRDGHCPIEQQAEADAAEKKALGADIALGIGGALVVAGVVLLVVSVTQDDADERASIGVFRF
jgi:hypothetical protein